MKLVALILLPLGLFAASAQATPPTTGVDLELISDGTSIQPGQPFNVGLHIQHHEGFHSYWQNPGIVGVPTSLTWNLPEGFLAGPIQWPHPEIVDMAGHPAHGFHRDVLLMVKISPPASIGATSVTIEAKINWMACSKTCHPGTEVRSLALPVNRTRQASKHRSLFKQAQSQIPPDLQQFTARMLSTADAPQIRLLLSARNAQTPALKEVYFFSSDGQVSSNQPQELRTLGKGRYLLTLRRSKFGPNKVPSLPGVLKAPIPLAAAGQPFAAIHPTYPDRNQPLPE